MNKYSSCLKQILKTVPTQILQLDEAEFSHKESKDTWSKKEILGHLVDSAYNNHQRFLRASSQENFVFDGYTQDDWVALNNYQERPLKELVSLWAQVNLHLCHLIDNLPEHLVNHKTTEHNFHKIGMNRPKEGEEKSLSYLIWDYVFHVEHHLAQIIEDYQKINGEFEV